MAVCPDGVPNSQKLASTQPVLLDLCVVHCVRAVHCDISVRCGHLSTLTITVTQGVVRCELNVASGWSCLWYVFSTFSVVKKVHLRPSQSSLPPFFFISSTPFMINYDRHSRSSHLWAFPVSCVFFPFYTHAPTSVRLKEIFFKNISCC